MLFYDVTTLYFETFEEDGLRKNGFSKDNKSQQPQILVALMVTPEGLPVSYEVFAGNTFEGHTLIPVIKSFIKKHKVHNFTVVADAAMISSANIAALREEKINYLESIAFKYELTGSSIVNVIHYVCLKAMADDKNIITKSNLQEGIKREYEKEDRVFKP